MNNKKDKITKSKEKESSYKSDLFPVTEMHRTKMNIYFTASVRVVGFREPFRLM